jgi:predicted RNase H-like nuclease (RuvC/YqgF family)
MHLIFVYEVQIMNEKNYKKRLDFQQKMISRQSKQIDNLKSENEELKSKLIEKDKIINTIEPMRKEMAESIEEHHRLKDQYKNMIDELKQMKNIINQEVYKNRWWLIKWLIK